MPNMSGSLFKQAKCIPAAQEQFSSKDTQLMDAGSINVQENGKQSKDYRRNTDGSC